MMNDQPPPGWFVWIAAYRGGVWSPLTIFQDRGALSPTPVPNADAAPYHIQATTFGIGHILFLVLGSNLPTIDRIFAGWQPEWGLHVWPSPYPPPPICPHA